MVIPYRETAQTMPQRAKKLLTKMAVFIPAFPNPWKYRPVTDMTDFPISTVYVRARHTPYKRLSVTFVTHSMNLPVVSP